MSRFGPDPRDFFDSVYQGTAPWDVGRPQPALIALFDEYPPLGPALDVGCGSGDLSIYLAQRGLQVTGIDFVEAAIVQAREKAGSLPSKVAGALNFQVADALQPALLKRRFGSVVDSGFLHLFDLEQRDRFADELASALSPGGRYYVLAFAIEYDVPNMPRQVTAEELQARFTSEKGWQIRALRSAEFLNRVAPPVPAVSACIERLL
jgi:SAM-dependent methyltransferase